MLTSLQLDTVNSLSNTGYAFGALVASGGVMGYVKGRSVPSIVAGVTVGSLCTRKYLSSETACAPS